MDKITNDWLQSAFIDLETIKEIIKNEQLTTVVSFHSQQAIEKSFKAVMESKSDNTPKTHKLLSLYENIKDLIDLKLTEEEIQTVEILDRLYIDSRYPGDFGLLPYGKPTLKDAEKFYNFSQKIFNLIKEQL
ncbi:MAG: HEPN domain-containing protein [Campylobacterales bacterium]|nr:HEPN domain-containing protein [Campylobacterales bacterium]